jgi:hypothetical protein
MSLINAALFYRQNNISIIATGENKRALIPKKVSY